MRRVLLPSLLLLAACADDDGGPQEPVDEGSPPEAGCTEGTLESGALSLICFPDDWNGTLVVYAHGYVEPSAPVALPDDDVGGVSISDAVTGFGYAYATTSYRDNGLVVLHYDQPAVETVLEPGMTFTIEPMINLGALDYEIWDDGWTVVTKDKKWTAQFEHTLVVTDDGAEILTVSD